MGSGKERAWGAESREESLRYLPENLVIIGLDTPDTSRTDHPLWDERIALPVDDDLVRSIVVHGFLPEGTIVVVKDGEDKTTGKPRALVRDGRQRVRAARAANVLRVRQGLDPVTIPAVPTRLGQLDDQMIGMIVGNSGRVDDNPVVKARKARDLLASGKRSEADVAAAFCTSVATLRGWLSILDRHPDVVLAVAKMQLPAGAAVKMEGLSQAEQKAKLGELLKLGRGKKVDEAIADEKGTRGRKRASLGRVASRKSVETLRAEIEDADFPEARVAKAMIGWFTGDVDALKPFPWLAEAVEKASSPRAKKSEAAA